jgi:hypothetical protein
MRGADVSDIFEVCGEAGRADCSRRTGRTSWLQVAVDTVSSFAVLIRIDASGEDKLYCHRQLLRENVMKAVQDQDVLRAPQCR